MKNKALKITLIISGIFNVVLISALIYQALNGCAEIANGRIGVLSQDTKVGYFGGDKTVFTLPKGLVVREASATGAGWFEPIRFRIVVTSDNESLVDYSVSKEQLDGQYNEYYSAEIHRNESIK